MNFSEEVKVLEELKEHHPEKLKCQNCGNDIIFHMVSIYDAFDIDVLLSCFMDGDFSPLYDQAYFALHINCEYCGKPAITDELRKILKDNFEIVNEIGDYNQDV